MGVIFDSEHTKINCIVLHEIKDNGRNSIDVIYSKKELSCDQETKNEIKAQIVNVMGDEGRSFEALANDNPNSPLVEISEKFFKEEEPDFFEFTKKATKFYIEALKTANTKKKEGILILINATEQLPNSQAREIVAFIKATPIKAIKQDEDKLIIVRDLFLSADSRFFKIGLMIKNVEVKVSQNINDNFKFIIFDDQIKGGSAQYFLNCFLGWSIDMNTKKRTEYFYETCQKFMYSYIDPDDAYNFEANLKAYLGNEEQYISASDFKERHIEDDLKVFFDIYIDKANLGNIFRKNNELIKYHLKTNTIPFSNQIKISYPSQTNQDDIEIITKETAFNEMEFNPDYTVIRVKGTPYTSKTGKKK